MDHNTKRMGAVHEKNSVKAASPKAATLPRYDTNDDGDDDNNNGDESGHQSVAKRPALAVCDDSKPAASHKKARTITMCAKKKTAKNLKAPPPLQHGTIVGKQRADKKNSSKAAASPKAGMLQRIDENNKGSLPRQYDYRIILAVYDDMPVYDEMPDGDGPPAGDHEKVRLTITTRDVFVPPLHPPLEFGGRIITSSHNITAYIGERSSNKATSQRQTNLQNFLIPDLLLPKSFIAAQLETHWKRKQQANQNDLVDVQFQKSFLPKNYPRVSIGDFKSLQYGHHLAGPVVLRMLAIIQKRDAELSATDPNHVPIHIMAPTFFQFGSNRQRYQDYQPNDEELRCSDAVPAQPIPTTQFFARCNYLLVPFQVEATYWILFVANFIKKTVSAYDSRRTCCRKFECEQILRYLVDEHDRLELPLIPGQWKVNPLALPWCCQETSRTDSAVCMLLHAQFLSLGMSIPAMLNPEEDFRKFQIRERMALIILNSFVSNNPVV